MPSERFSFRRENTAGKGERLDLFLGSHLENVSRSRIQKWIEDGFVLLNGNPAVKKSTVHPGDTVKAEIPAETEQNTLVPENIPLQIVYEDEEVAIVNKPKGMVTHPGNGVRTGTLANALAYRYASLGGLSDAGGRDRPGIVHRLDRDTSGLLVVARTNAAHTILSTQLAERKIHRAYAALCWRELPSENGEFSEPLGRHPRDPTRRTVREDGKSALTLYKVKNSFQFASHLEIRLGTGRTHQIRVHLSHAGFPVVGDPLYGGRESMLKRIPPMLETPAVGLLQKFSSQALHAENLAFTHPKTGKRMEFTSALPVEFTEALELLEPYRREKPL